MNNNINLRYLAMKVTALVPCYNEEKTIGNVLKVLIASPLIEKIIVVDDGSTDQSAKIIKKYQEEKLKAIFLPHNLGKGEAVREGLKKVLTKVTFLCDADIKGLKETHLNLLVKTFNREKRQIVVGLREKRLGQFGHFFRKNFLPLIAGERILSTSLLKEAIKNPLASNWGLEPYINYHCRRKREKITKILLRGVNDSPKWKKGHGWKLHFKEALALIFKYFLIYSLYFPYQILSARLSPKKSKRDEFKIRKVKIDKKIINFAQIGKGEPLLLIHGWANNWEGWIPLAMVLKNKYKLYLIDLPGFGDSSSLKAYTIDIQADYVFLFLKKIKVCPKATIGLSMGSLVTAALGKNYPKATKTIVLLSAPFKKENHFLATKALEKGLTIVKGKERAEALLKKIVESQVTAYLLAKYINMHKFNKFLVDTYGMIGKKKMTKEAFVQMGLSGAKFNLQNVLDNYHPPIFLIYGAKDKIISLTDAQEMLKNKRGNFSFASVPSAGHVIPWEKPQKVAHLIEKFLKKV